MTNNKKPKVKVTKHWTVEVKDLLPGSHPTRPATREREEIPAEFLYPNEPSHVWEREKTLFRGSPNAFEIWKHTCGGVLVHPDVTLTRE